MTAKTPHTSCFTTISNFPSLSQPFSFIEKWRFFKYSGSLGSTSRAGLVCLGCSYLSFRFKYNSCFHPDQFCLHLPFTPLPQRWRHAAGTGLPPPLPNQTASCSPSCAHLQPLHPWDLAITHVCSQESPREASGHAWRL